MTLAATTPPDDAALLRDYVQQGSEAAFAELVRRRVNLVHSTARRQVDGDAEAALDITQAVFAELARQAVRLIRHPALTGWLYTTTYRLATHHVRSEIRRQRREQEAHAMQDLHHHTADGETELDWAQLRPVLDAAMHELAEHDRLAILLRHFEQRPLAEVGTHLGLTENAARMRVDRALDKLRAKLEKRGVTSTGTALAIALAGQAVTTTPAALASAVTAAALAAALTTNSTLKILSVMASTKLKLATGAVLITAAATVFVTQYRSNSQLADGNAALHRQIGQLLEDAQVARQAAARAEEEKNDLRQSHAELLRLRDEVGQLRRDSSHTTKAGEIASRSQAERSPVWNPGQFLASGEWRDVGLEKPELAIITFLGALMQGNAERLADASDLAPDTLEKMKKVPPEFLREVLGMTRAIGAVLLERSDVSENECELIYEISWDGGIPPGMTTGINRARVSRSGSQWKVAMPGPIAQNSGDGK